MERKQVILFASPNTGGSVPGGVNTRISCFSSLLEFSRVTKAEDPVPTAHDANYPEVFQVIEKGWASVLDSLVEAEEETRAAFAPTRTNPWGYTGGRISIDRMLAGKPCVSRPVRKVQTSNKFCRLVFVGEGMSGSTSANFLKKCAQLMTFIRTAQGKGVQVELWGAWGGWTGANKTGAMSLVKVKGFAEPINLPILSGVGHAGFLRTLQFGSERGHMGNADSYPRSFATKEVYREGLSHFIGAESANSATVMCNIHEIDPLGLLKTLA